LKNAFNRLRRRRAGRPTLASAIRVGADELERDRPDQHRVLPPGRRSGRALAGPAPHHEVVELLGRLDAATPPRPGEAGS
jgi:hypothetical protein